MTTGVVHSGRFAAQLGSFSRSEGDSSIAQTFTAPHGVTVLSLWYDMTCADTVAHDWAVATLVDKTTKATATILHKTCTKGAGWVEVTATVHSGSAYTLKITSHDDDDSGTATVTRVDDVTLGP